MLKIAHISTQICVIFMSKWGRTHAEKIDFNITKNINLSKHQHVLQSFETLETDLFNVQRKMMLYLEAALHAAYAAGLTIHYYIQGYSTLLVNYIILPWLLVFSLRRMKPWWDPCSCLKTWCRTRGGGGDKDMENERAWCECVCVDAYVQYVQSLLLFPSCPAVVWIEPECPTMTWTKGPEWNTFSLPAEF